MSESTAKLLQQTGQFVLTPRGEIDVKGKGMMSTYWLESKINFNPMDLPSVYEESERMLTEMSMERSISEIGNLEKLVIAGRSRNPSQTNAPYEKREKKSKMKQHSQVAE